MDAPTLANLISTARRQGGHPITVGISGFGGSGKSTLARSLTNRVEGSVRMRGDDFLDPTRSHRRSSDWDGVERLRLASDVLAPFREQTSSTFQRFDWSARELGPREIVPTGDVMIVDLIGLFHPEATGALDLRIWGDVDLETATDRGIARDALLGRDHVTLWHDVWVPNERDFMDNFSPRDTADAVFTA